MTKDERARTEDLCRRAKTGERMTAEEQAFLQRMFRTYPAEYRGISREARDWAAALMNPMHRRRRG